MPLRNLEYTALMLGEMDRRKELGRPGHWPPVLPLVLYNGDTPWADALEMREMFGPMPDEPLRENAPAISNASPSGDAP